MGRLSSIDWALSIAITPIGTLASGPLAELFGESNLFLFCSIIGMIITLVLWWIAHKRINNNNKKNELKGIELSIEKTQMDTYKKSIFFRAY